MRHPALLLGIVSTVLGGVIVTAACSHLAAGRDGEQAGGPGGGTGGPGGGQKPPAYDAGPGDEITDGAAPDVVKTACVDTPYSDPWSPGYTPDPAIQSTVQSVVGGMSISERADQMRGTNPGGGSNYSDIFRTPDNTNKGIKGFLFRDGPRGVNLAAQLPAGKNGWSTTFPVPMARGAAFDMDLEYRIGTSVGDETLASGNTMLLGPTVNILRHPAWGRAQETYGEDTYLLGRLGSAFVAGIQTFVPACAKHYAANNIENGRASSNAQMDEQTLREIYARHFEMIIRDGGVACIMASYNLINGKKATQNKHLLNDLLRTDIGFKGFVMSDWWAMPPGSASASSDALQANAAEAVNAGMDMELPWSYNFQQLEAITGAGKPITEAAVTQGASRVVEQKFRFNVAKTGTTLGLSKPTTTLGPDGSIINNEAHIAIAHEAALKAMVLLKNDANTLPIDRTTVKTIAVIGAAVPYHLVNADQANGTINFATDPRLGDLGSSRVFSDPGKSSGPFAGIKAAAGSINVVSGTDPNLADNADFVVVVAGLTPEDEGEEYTGAGDRSNFALDGKNSTNAQNNLIAAVATKVAAKKTKMVVVLEGGSVIDMPWLAQVPAVVMAWYPGIDGGRALGDLLMGNASFSGKLPITWPKQWNDEPAFNSGSTTVMDYYLGYRFFDKNNVAPLYPFGHGLSYTTFEYKYLQIPCSDVTKGGVVNVQADVTNTGKVEGDEVSYLFVGYPKTKGRRSVKELKGFHRVTVKPGETKRITFALRVADLKYWDEPSNSWIIESGPVDIMVGGSSDNLPLKDTLIVK